MNLIPWRDPDRLLTSLRAEMDRMFDRITTDPWPLAMEGTRSPWIPSIDLSETDKDILLKADVPGVDPKNLQVTVKGNLLTITGEKREATEEKKENCLRVERHFGSFRREVMLPAEVDLEKVSAEYENGVLTVHLKKHAGAASRQVPITAKKGT